MLIATAFYNDPLILFIIGLALMLMFFWYFATEIERRRRNVGTVLTLGICALCIAAVIPPKDRLKGGIDILGGSSFSLHIQPRMDEEGNEMPITPSQVDQAITVIEKRLNSMGTAEPIIARQGSNGILLQMPGVEPQESERIRASLQKVAKLQLHKVSPRNDELGPDRKSLAARVAERLEKEPGYLAFNHKSKDQDGKEIQRPILLKRIPGLGGADIALATPSPQQADAVSITLNGPGTDKMIALTKDLRPGVDRIAIVLDGEVISAPVVNQVPLGKQFIVEGLSEPGEVQNLANSLMNPLENALVVDEMRTVSPTLGSAVVKQGLAAGGLALLMTFLVVLLYYRVSGLIAIVGLIVNTIMLFGVMAMFGFTFTLPGIAGMILTIGMAVDANVLIYERLREEIRGGKSLKNAIEASYDRAFSAIFDSHVTSLITAAILFAFGGSAIKGFAITLIIGVTASLFSAILVTRVIFRWGIDFGMFKKLTFLDLIKSSHYDFMGKRRICIILAIITLVISIGAFGVRGERAMGIDFTGGTLIKFQLGKETKIPLDEVRKVVEGMQLSKAAYPQQEKNLTTGTMITVRCATKDSKAIIEKLRESIPALGEMKPDSKEYAIDASQDEVSALIGGTALTDSLIAIALGLLGIVLYMTLRFEFSFALGGFVAIFHDIIICVGAVVLMGGELSLIHVGAVLTIAGYSISDTIVVFDRVREMLLTRTDSVEKIMNEAVNATLSRTLLTSAATLISVAILAFLGGTALRDFGVVIFIGIIVGTFSSIFIASPVVLWWSKRKGGSIRDVVLASVAKEESISAAP
ncbi:MAG: protein translocase subunit SecD [Akkermansiaceae bacterium]|jgi:SecD/SecF fusion protein|nr:protein translocase subunit SecD [Akkermansiaceae bacterium]MBJ7395827.1 protein translocase subunit SecD [Akkermansiaceae bacterium]MBJ7422870.1 protein translocase subunit SecD [Akkermansiaceae bacterium]